MIRMLLPHNDLPDNCPLMDDEGNCVARYDYSLHKRSRCDNFSDMCPTWQKLYLKEPSSVFAEYLVFDEEDIDVLAKRSWEHWVISYCRRIKMRNEAYVYVLKLIPPFVLDEWSVNERR